MLAYQYSLPVCRAPLIRYLLTPADHSAGLSSADVALNGGKLEVVGASGPNPTLPHLRARAREGSKLSLPGLSFGFFGKPARVINSHNLLLLCAYSIAHTNFEVWYSIAATLERIIFMNLLRQVVSASRLRAVLKGAHAAACL